MGELSPTWTRSPVVDLAADSVTVAVETQPHMKSETAQGPGKVARTAVTCAVTLAARPEDGGEAVTPVRVWRGDAPCWRGSARQPNVGPGA